MNDRLFTIGLQRCRRALSPGIRAQLTLWYTAIFALLILVLSTSLYATLQVFLASDLDSSLQLRTQQVAAGIVSENEKITIRDVTGELPELGTATTTDAPSDVNVGVLVRVLLVKGQVLYTSPAFRALTVPSASISGPLRGTPWLGTVFAHNGQAVRLYSIALSNKRKVFGVLQVGESLARLTATLRSVYFALLAIIPFVVLLSAFGSYWLAKRAFRPIHQLTRTARDIGAGDLQRRVPIPQARDELYNLAATLNEMIGRLEQAFTQQRRFVADASHELRTPVSVIRTITDVALAQPASLEECVSILRDVNAEAERLGQLINDLLILARADERQVPLDREPVRLDLLALDVAATMEPLAIEHGIALQVEQMEAATVLGDTARLIQAMMGLVDNALTYTNVGGKVTLNVEVNSTQACFSVHDTGIGIAPEDVVHIFERFYRADPARCRAGGGSGLGLAIVDWVVRAHEGSVSVESQLGQGSTFRVILPRPA
jgi:two-component system OmpR family sensor kinase